MPFGRIPDTKRSHGCSRLVGHESRSDLVVRPDRVPSTTVPFARRAHSNQTRVVHAVPVRPSHVHRGPIGPHHHLPVYGHVVAAFPVVFPARIRLRSRSNDTRVWIHFGSTSVSRGPQPTLACRHALLIDQSDGPQSQGESNLATRTYVTQQKKNIQENTRRRGGKNKHVVKVTLN